MSGLSTSAACCPDPLRRGRHQVSGSRIWTAPARPPSCIPMEPGQQRSSACVDAPLVLEALLHVPARVVAGLENAAAERSRLRRNFARPDTSVRSGATKAAAKEGEGSGRVGMGSATGPRRRSLIRRRHAAVPENFTLQPFAKLRTGTRIPCCTIAQLTATFSRRSGSLSSLPAPITTVASGSSAIMTGRPVSLRRYSSNLRRSATPPVSMTPRS